MLHSPKLTPKRKPIYLWWLEEPRTEIGLAHSFLISVDARLREANELLEFPSGPSLRANFATWPVRKSFDELPARGRVYKCDFLYESDLVGELTPTILDFDAA